MWITIPPTIISTCIRNHVTFSQIGNSSIRFRIIVGDSKHHCNSRNSRYSTLFQHTTLLIVWKQITISIFHFHQFIGNTICLQFAMSLVIPTLYPIRC